MMKDDADDAGGGGDGEGSVQMLDGMMVAGMVMEMMTMMKLVSRC